VALIDAEEIVSLAEDTEGKHHPRDSASPEPNHETAAPRDFGVTRHHN
jgi:hypothetical protein